MIHWPFWASGLALAAVAVGHWLLVGRMIAVSGRFTSLVNRLRWGAPKRPAPAADADLLAALQAATVEAFGPGALAAPGAAPDAVDPPRAAGSAQDQPAWLHVLFFLGLAGGGLASALLAGTFEVTLAPRGELFARTFGAGGPALLPLLLGGLLVGFGTRMAGGCTSGHGLCGTSRLQPGSLLATGAFFGAGIVVSLLLGGLR